MNPRDFQQFKNRQIQNALQIEGGIPIIGQQPDVPAIVRDQIGRELRSGDYVILQSPTNQPFRVTSVSRVDPKTQPPNTPPLMEIRLESVAVYRAIANTANNEFLRHLSREESDALRAGQEPAMKQEPEQEIVAEELIPTGGEPS